MRVKCRQRDNYRTIFDDFCAVYLFGIQSVDIDLRIDAFTPRSWSVAG